MFPGADPAGQGLFQEPPGIPAGDSGGAGARVCLLPAVCSPGDPRLTRGVSCPASRPQWSTHPVQAAAAAAAGGARAAVARVFSASRSRGSSAAGAPVRRASSRTGVWGSCQPPSEPEGTGASQPLGIPLVAEARGRHPGGVAMGRTS